MQSLFDSDFSVYYLVNSNYNSILIYAVQKAFKRNEGAGEDGCPTSSFQDFNSQPNKLRVQVVPVYFQNCQLDLQHRPAHLQKSRVRTKAADEAQKP
jgi:hypothetical protein